MYYVYELIDPRTNLPFYVGKGSGERARFHLSEKARAKSDNPRKFNKIQKIRSEGFEPEVKIIKYFESESDAYEFEEMLIQKYGRIRYDKDGILTNLCESSKPPKLKGKTYQEIYGENWKEEIEKRMSTKQKNGNYGGVKFHTEKTKRKISEKVSGKNNPSYGVPCSEERKRKIKEKAKERFANGFIFPHAQQIKIISPENKEFIIFGRGIELQKFCNEHKISYATMAAAVTYNRKGPRRNGWSIEKL